MVEESPQSRCSAIELFEVVWCWSRGGRRVDRSPKMHAMLTSTDVDFDPAAAMPELALLRSALGRQDWAAARAVLDAAEPALRTQLIRDGAEVPGVEGLLWQVHAQEPEDTAAAAMLGAYLVKTGWAIRTTARASHVSREQFAALRDWLCRAEQVLIEAAARNPADCAVWVERLPTARGLQLGLSESRRRYDRLASVDPHHLPGQFHMVQQLCPKWSGSWEQAHAFARECMLAAPAGSLQGGLVAEVHLEQWLDLEGGAAGERYLLAEPVQTQLYEAAHRSVWHADFRQATGWVRVASVFAMLFSLVGDEPAARRLFVALGRVGSEYPWQYFANPSEQFRIRRARALAQGERR